MNFLGEHDLKIGLILSVVMAIIIPVGIYANSDKPDYYPDNTAVNYTSVFSPCSPTMGAFSVYTVCIREDYIISQNNLIIQQNQKIIKQNEIGLHNQEVLKCYELHKSTSGYVYRFGFGIGGNETTSFNADSLKKTCGK